MLFLQPLALLLLGGALVPPLLHLFQRRRPADVTFPAVRYLRQTEQESSRTIRLRNLVLLLLRMAAVGLVALAAARPVVPARLGAGVGGGHEPTALVLVLDNSLSSGAVAGGTRVFDDLAARARETLLAAQPGDALWLIRADGVARRGSRDELLRAVAASGPEATRLDVTEAVRTAASLVRASGLLRGEIHVLSDLQASAFGARDSAAAGLPLLFYHPQGAPPPNRAVVAARAVPATWLASPGGASGTVAATVGGAPHAGAAVTVSASVAGRTIARTLAASGESVSLAVTAPRAGWIAGLVSVEPDELRADDDRPFAVRVVAPAAVAIAPRADLGRFVGDALAVLQRAGQVVAGPGVVLGESAPAGLAPGQAAVVFPPHDPVGLGAANRSLAAAGVPWRFGAAVVREDTLAAPQVPAIAGARVARRYRLDPAGSAAPGAVLARAGGDPWLVRSGRVLVVGSRLVPEETALPLSGSFVPFLSDLVNRLARGEEGIVTAAPGDAVSLPAEVAAIGLGADSLQPVAAAAPAAPAVTAPAAPGVYPLVTAGADTVGELVVAPDPRESDLTRISDAALASLVPGARITVAAGARRYAAARFLGAGRAEFTGPLLVLALAVTLLEAAVAAGAFGRARAAEAA